jgi:hypothetical protein
MSLDEWIEMFQDTANESSMFMLPGYNHACPVCQFSACRVTVVESIFGDLDALVYECISCRAITNRMAVIGD